MSSRTMNTNRGATPGSTRPGWPDAPATGKGNADIVAPETPETPDAALFAEYPELMKAEHVAEILSTSKAAVYRMIREGQLPVVQIGPKYVYVPKHKFVAMITAANE